MNLTEISTTTMPSYNNSGSQYSLSRALINDILMLRVPDSVLIHQICTDVVLPEPCDDFKSFYKVSFLVRNNVNVAPPGTPISIRPSFFQEGLLRSTLEGRERCRDLVQVDLDSDGA